MGQRFVKQYPGWDLALQRDWGVRIVSITHALVCILSMPGFFNPDPELRDDIYGAQPADSTVPFRLERIYAFSCGYFFYDLLITIYFGWGAAFFAHAIASLGVTYFGLYPFMLYYGTYFLGVFEISTVPLHLRYMLMQAKVEGVLLKAVEIVFFVTFSIIRPLYGSYMSYLFWCDLYELWSAGQGHSLIVFAFCITANVVLMALQIYWWLIILKTLAGFDEVTRESVADENNKKAKKA